MFEHINSVRRNTEVDKSSKAIEGINLDLTGQAHDLGMHLRISRLRISPKQLHSPMMMQNNFCVVDSFV